MLKRLIEVIHMQDDMEAMKKYYSEAAWAKMKPRYEQGPSPEWIALYGEVEAALGEDPAGETAQALAARWMALADDSPDRDEQTRAGAIKAWADRENWPPAMKQRMENYHLDKLAPFIAKAVAAHRKKYYSEEAWAKLSARPQAEQDELAAAWNALFVELRGVLGDEPASEKAQALAKRWLELAKQSTSDEPELKAGAVKAWEDHKNWPPTMLRQVSSLELEQLVAFVGKAIAIGAMKDAEEDGSEAGTAG
jgi:hypothetical protein